MNITDKSQLPNNTSKFALFELGFRPFFLGAGVFAVISMLYWTLIYQYQIGFSLDKISSSQWHAHEMIYGYTFAVIAGFLLTAVRNWTGLATITGKPLMLCFSFWLAARVLFVLGTNFLWLAAIFDLLFSLILIIAISRPIYKVKQWKQASIVGKVILLFIFNLLFYLGLLDSQQEFTSLTNANAFISLSLYGGIYLILALVLTMGRRVVPFFIENGVDSNFKAVNYRWVDLSNLYLFLAFFIVELFFNMPLISALLALALFAVGTVRLVTWYTAQIWHKFLLWSLYLSFVWLNMGFLLFASTYFMGVSPYIAIHAFAVGTVGLITLSMMSRVSLGHTGRNIHEPPKGMSFALMTFVAASLIRVIGPLFDVSHYQQWVGLSQLLWIVSFSIFVWVLLPILIRPRVDGQPG